MLLQLMAQQSQQQKSATPGVAPNPALLAALLAQSAGGGAKPQGGSGAQAGSAAAAANPAAAANMLAMLSRLQQAAAVTGAAKPTPEMTAHRIVGSVMSTASPTSSIPPQLIERVAGRARIRAMASLLDPDLQLEDSVVEVC